VSGIAEPRKSLVVAGEVVQCYFWHGILWVGDVGEHAFFDVKRRTNPDFSSASLFTTDVPPVLVRADDTLVAFFLLENSTGLQTVRHKVGQASASAAEVCVAVFFLFGGTVFCLSFSILLLSVDL
jgi:hypothetical protein